MRSKVLLLFLLLPFLKSWSQNPATIFTIPNRNVTLACGTTCLTLTATVPHIKQTNDYVVTNIPYLPFAYKTATGTEVTPIYDDDTWSPIIDIGFPFCFYGATYPSLLMGSNSNITFDLSLAGRGSGYIISATAGSIPRTAYAKASIFGPYHDINPNATNSNPANRKIEYRVEGTAPARRFIASYNEVSYFGENTCNSNIATHQMVLYESTGVIEVYIKDKPFCPDWNNGLAILGIQDYTQTRGVAAPGKNATQWGSVGMNEGYRFTPNGAAPRFKRAELLVNNSVVGVADTISGAPSLLNLTFNNVCPNGDSTAYVLKVTYGTCNNPALDVSFTDTVRVKKTIPALTIVPQNATCTTTGNLTVNVGAVPGNTFQYSLNGGALQTSNVFSNLTPGNYLISAQGTVNGCAANKQATVALANNLVVNALPSDTSVCVGNSFTPRVATNGTSFVWTPTGSASNPQAQQPVITPTVLSTQYIVTATLGTCQAKDTINVTSLQTPQVNAGPDLTIILGDQVQLQATAGAGTYAWTPATALSASNVLRPFATPTVTTAYKLTVTNANGCTASDEVLVTVLTCMDPMNAFSPNGDGINDKWMVTTGACFKSAYAQVFNRYGAKVFEDRNYQNQWDGTYKGKPLPDGTYYFIVSYQLINGKSVYMKGNVTILR